MSLAPSGAGLTLFKVYARDGRDKVGGMVTPLIELLTKPGCHLCESARQVTQEVVSRYGLSFTEINVEDHPDLLERHRTEIPVLRVDGEVKDFWQINPRRLARLLEKKLAD